MPCYEFFCVRCNRSFLVTLGANVYVRQEVKCPICGCNRAAEVVGPLVGDAQPATHSYAQSSKSQ
jgi:DNA-directed RNA polymerase subunit RPC12/RpoP